VAEDHCGFVAAAALDIHKIGVGSGHKPLEFVRLPFGLKGGM